MEISEFQKNIKKIYYKNDKKRGAEKTFLWLCEEVGELAASLAEKNKQKTGQELADTVAWCFSIANVLGISLEKQLTTKYPGKCPSCGKKTCQCRDKP